jgi:hypothetical protein
MSVSASKGAPEDASSLGKNGAPEDASSLGKNGAPEDASSLGKKRGEESLCSAPSFDVKPVAELCRQVFSWAFRGKAGEAAALAHSIPLDFPWVWCKEGEYSEKTSGASIALLGQALRRKELLRGDPYFQTVAQHLAKTLARPLDFKSGLDWSLIETERLKCCLTFSGSSTSLGAIITDGAEVRAFGPQIYPLSDPKGFGIRRIEEHGNRWATPAAAPAVWFEMRSHCKENQLALDLIFYGLEPSAALAFSFFVKAEAAQIGNEKFKPKTLQRYQGASKPIRFGSGLVIESKIEGKMELIPLAGSGGYWDSEYLAAFEIHPINAKMSFLIYSHP